MAYPLENNLAFQADLDHPFYLVMEDVVAWLTLEHHHDEILETCADQLRTRGRLQLEDRVQQYHWSVFALSFVETWVPGFEFG